MTRKQFDLLLKIITAIVQAHVLTRTWEKDAAMDRYNSACKELEKTLDP